MEFTLKLLHLNKARQNQMPVGQRRKFFTNMGSIETATLLKLEWSLACFKIAPKSAVVVAMETLVKKKPYVTELNPLTYST